MSMCGVIGFDHYLNGTVTQSYINTKVVVPLAAGGTKVLDLFTAGSGLTLGYGIATEPMEGKQAFKMTVTAGVGEANTYGAAGIRVPLEDSTLPRTGTWVFGCWLGSSASRGFATARALTGLVSYGSTNQAINLANNTFSYVEVMVEWSTSKIYIYQDGVLVATWTILAAGNVPVVIGATRYNTSAVTNSWNWAGIGNGDYCYFRDVYFAINPTGDANPVSRLGKCRVLPHPVASITGNRWGTSLASGDMVASLNTKLDNTQTPVVTSSPFNDVATARFGALTPPVNYSNPLFMQVDYAVTMDNGAGVKFVHQAGGNTAVTETLTAGATTHFVERGIPSGGTITQSTITALDIKMNSVPG